MAVKKKEKSEPAEPARKVNCQLPGADLVEAGKSVEEAANELLNKELSDQHDLFCREYIIDDNQTRAYMRAYPNSSYGAAAVSSHDLLKKPKIIGRIAQLRADRDKRLEISADTVLRRTVRRARFDMRDLYCPDGSFIPIHELDPDVSIGIKSVEVVELFDGQGENRRAIGLVRKITCFDGRQADELLGRNLGMWKDVGSKENPAVQVHKIERVIIKPK